MLSYKSNSLSTIVPNKVVQDYPHFVEFMEAYYEWSVKTTIEVKGVIGNFDIAERMRTIETELDRELEVVVESERSFTTQFEDNKTFIEDEGIIAYRPHSNPIPVSFNTLNEFVFCCKITNKITLFRGQKYFIENDTDYPFYIKSARIYGTDQQYEPVINNGSTSSLIELNVTETYPNFLYFVSPVTEVIGIISIVDVPIEFSEIAEEISDSNSLLGISQVDNVLFHPEYLYDNFPSLNTTKAPDALFNRFLSNYGLETFFKNNFKYRNFFKNFLEFFRQRGTENGIKFLFQNFFDRNISFDYPGERVLRLSESDYFSYDEMYVEATYGEELLRNDVLVGKLSNARAVIESTKYVIGQDYYKLFLNAEKRQGDFILGEKLFVIDKDDPNVEHDIDGIVLGTISDVGIVEPGNEFLLGEEISDTYTVAGVVTTVSLTVDAISDAEINRVNILNSGVGYEVDDVVYFPTPNKKVKFGGIVAPHPEDGKDVYNSNTMAINIEDYSLYEPIDFVGAEFNYQGTNYEVLSWSGGSPDVITIRSNTSDPVKPTVRTGQLIVLTVDEDNVTDPFYDSTGEFFHPSRNVVKSAARGVVTSVTESGFIETIRITNPGEGYVKKPTTSNGGITIITTSGVDAELEVIGQSFGGLVSVTLNNDIVGPKFNSTITISRPGSNNDGVLELVSDISSKYGQFFSSNKGFISDEIYIQDSFYYQDYSYVIQSDLNLVDFSGLLRRLAHPAGMIFFNQFFITRIFDQKLNRGADTLITPKKITIEKGAYKPLLLIGDLTINVQGALDYVFTQQLRNNFLWSSASVYSLESSYDLLADSTISGTTESGTDYLTVSGFQDIVLQSGTPIQRDRADNQFRTYMNLNKQITISGIGTVTYSDTSSGESYSQLNEMGGTATSFFEQVAYNDLIHVVDETFRVHSVQTDTKLIVQRLNTTGPVTLTDEPYTINANRRTEMINARFIDLLYFDDNISISGYLSDTWSDFLNEVYIT